MPACEGLRDSKVCRGCLDKDAALFGEAALCCSGERVLQASSEQAARDMEAWVKMHCWLQPSVCQRQLPLLTLRTSIEGTFQKHLRGIWRDWLVGYTSVHVLKHL